MTPRNLTLQVHLVSAAAWVLFGGMWASMHMVEVGLGFQAALWSTLRNVGTAWLLSYGIWWLTGKVSWQERLSDVRFLLTHLIGALLFGVVWLLLLFVTLAIERGWGLAEFLASAGPFPWRFQIVMLLYGSIAGISYSVRFGRALSERRHAVMQMRKELVEAQLEALLARLNPHFLFNALHSISGLQERDPKEARLALIRLGDLLRYVLRPNPGPAMTVTLAEEIAFVNEYLELERLRLGPKLRFSAEIEPSAEDLHIPPLLIQPLVENAVIHGVASQEGGGQVKLAVSSPEAMVYISVINTYSPTEPSVGHGSGLATLRRRLQLRYGERAKLTTSPRQHEQTHWFETVLALPIASSETAEEPAQASRERQAGYR